MEENKKTRWVIIEKGRWYFSKETERKLFFVMTLVMLVIGIVIKM